MFDWWGNQKFDLTHNRFPRRCCRHSRRSHRIPKTWVYIDRFYTPTETRHTLQTRKPPVRAIALYLGTILWVRMRAWLHSRHFSSSLPSPQSSQPSHCRVWLMHRLL